MRRYLPSFLVFSFFFSLFSGVTAFAADSAPNASQVQAGNLIPNTSVKSRDGYEFDCVRFMKIPKLRSKVTQEFMDIDRALVKVVDGSIQVADTAYPYPIDSSEGTPLDLAMTCAIKSGRVPLWLVPYFIVRAVDYLLYLAGIISVLFIVIGGYHWIVGSYSEDKESGKKTIMHALLGLVISLVAYTAVNLLMYLLTS